VIKLIREVVWREGVAGPVAEMVGRTTITEFDIAIYDLFGSEKRDRRAVDDQRRVRDRDALCDPARVPKVGNDAPSTIGRCVLRARRLSRREGGRLGGQRSDAEEPRVSDVEYPGPASSRGVAV
jgi:hypothetical protein